MGLAYKFHSENHSFNDTTKLIREQELVSKDKIGNNIWVEQSYFLDGSVIGNNCVIAAGSVINGVLRIIQL
jgi:acetyltransferase-like isoleucine patch superfamily enzyme